MLILFAAMIGIMYFVIWRPQRQKQKALQEQVGSVKTGDHVVTIGGIHGLVGNVKNTTIVLKVDDGTRIEFDKSAIGSVAKKDKPGAGEEKPEAEAKK